MTKYVCDRCNYESFCSKNVERHIKKKIPCVGQGELKVNTVTGLLTCGICSSVYNTYNGLKKHQRTSCKSENSEKLLEKMDELEKQLQLVTQAVNAANTNPQINTINTINISQINNFITISITPYNNPNLDGIQKYYEAAIKKTFMSVPSLIESVHFNHKYPENQNICITNKRTNDAKVFDGKKWKTVNKNMLITEMIDTYERELTNFAEENGKTRYIKNYELAKKRDNSDKELEQEIHNVIYDNSPNINTRIKEVKKLCSFE